MATALLLCVPASTPLDPAPPARPTTVEPVWSAALLPAVLPLPAVFPLPAVAAVPPVSAVRSVGASVRVGSVQPGEVVPGGFRWPLPGTPELRRRFTPPPEPWLPGHRGVDLAAGPGSTVHAAGPGVVLFAGAVAGRPVVTVGHADGLRTTYEPVQPVVDVGQRLDAGGGLGVLLPGHPGCSATACLHWGLRRGQEYLDPLSLLGLGPVRLLPLPD
ncbi:M23 family metallopeptidase [Micromonospora sp. NPDC000207]|uniref:M23 family metallopeptidase n=1 Tax=Micromonospora sp. NPDC000207 TaxID=3154246 RepID=UPI00332C812A